MAYVALPAFRAAPGLDFSGLNEGLDVLGKTIEKNRLLAQQKEIGAALQGGQSGGQTATSSEPPSYGPPSSQNALLAAPRTAAQYGANSAVSRVGGANPSVDFIKSQEGYTPNAQWDRRQYSSGYGTKAKPGEVVDRATAEQRLNAEVAPIDRWIAQNIKVPLTPEQKAGLTSFAYNLGVDDLQKLSGDINAGNWERVAQRMPSFNKALNEKTRQLEVVDGLTNRRMREAALVRGGGGASVTRSAPQSSGPNYDAAARVAFGQGNLDVGLRLTEAQRHAANDAQSGELRGLQISQARQELETAAQKRVASIAQTIEAQTDPAQRQALWSKFVGSNPKIATTLQNYGIDPNDHAAGSAFLIAEARGLEVPKLSEVSPGATLYDPVSRKSVYTAPNKPLQQLTAGDRKEILTSDDAAQAGKSAILSLTKAIELNDKANYGPAAQTRGYVQSLYGSEAGKATEDLNNLVTSQALEQLKATFGAAPTEGERKILLDIQGSTNMAPAVRKGIWERAVAMAQRRVDFNMRQSEALRSGQYYTPGYTPVTLDTSPVASAPAPGPAANNQARPRAENKQTGQIVEFNEQTGQWEPVQ